MNDTKEKAPYMGVINVGRVSGQADLFDSDVRHQHFIEVSISQASRERHLSTNWIHGEEELVSVWMTELQWAHFVSSFNQGSGTPVTLRHIRGKRVELPPPARPETTKFKQEVMETAKESLDALRGAVAKLEAALVPKAKLPNKGELTAILSDLGGALRHFTANIPFVETQFDEHMEKKLNEAKTEFEGYMGSRLRDLGLEAAALQATLAGAPRPSFLTEGDAEKE
jgi:hypothetical protein